MTTRPRLRREGSVLPGLLAVVLFGLMVAVVLNTQFGGPTGFPEGLSITSEIGYALFDLEALQSTEGAVADTEPFLVALLLIAIVLDAALDAALVLAKREDEGEPVAPLATTSATSSRAGSDVVADGGRDRTATDGGESTDRSTDGGESR
ncbi:hypothetical protein [Halopiger goleimassiliensis]|uniref:hypothetical protein n=1 Tax=Halopiger goleimassiliensis TaxID=1293048 RepID=UPI000678005F|nr:hypothetical protein [Halopiger goleimassiliensis]